MTTPTSKRPNRRVEQLSAALADLEPDDADHLASLLREQAARRRRRVTVDEARIAYGAASLTPAAERSTCHELLRIRATAKELLLAGWRPEQYAEALATIGLEVWNDGQMVASAIAAGIRDGKRARA